MRNKYTLAACFVVLPILLLSCDMSKSTPADSSARKGILSHAYGSAEVRYLISSYISSSKSSIICSSPDLSSAEISGALKDALLRKVSVRIAVDAKNSFGKIPLELLKAGAKVHGRSFDTAMNSSFLVIDKSVVISGIFCLDGSSAAAEFALAARDSVQVKRYAGEFELLDCGSVPSSKDADFDYCHGPYDWNFFTNRIYDTSWYRTLPLSYGTSKGIWPVTQSSSVFKTWFSPYPLSETEYQGYTASATSAGTYEYGTGPLYNFRSFDAEGGSSSAHIRDFRIIIISKLRNASQNIIIAASELSDPLTAHEIIECAKKGVSVSVFLDEGAKASKRYNAVIADALVKETAGLRFVRTADGSSLRGSIFFIDGNTICLTAGGLTEEAFLRQDNYLLAVHDAEELIRSGKKLTDMLRINSLPAAKSSLLPREETR